MSSGFWVLLGLFSSAWLALDVCSSDCWNHYLTIWLAFSREARAEILFSFLVLECGVPFVEDLYSFSAFVQWLVKLGVVGEASSKRMWLKSIVFCSNTGFGWGFRKWVLLLFVFKWSSYWISFDFRASLMLGHQIFSIWIVVWRGRKKGKVWYWAGRSQWRE